MDKIVLQGEEGDSLELYVLESTRLGAVDYLLATDAEKGDGDCYILKDTSAPEDTDSIYELVTDEHELDYLAGVFAELVDDADIEF